jgi:small subunit ribosomal protein S17
MSPAESGSAAGTAASTTADTGPRENHRRVLRGTVISDVMAKTITVRVERIFKHTKYEKYIRRHKKYHAHDEENAAHVGDEVDIIECRPLSKIKRFRLLSVVRKADVIEGGDL